jgi:signal transduction histidine kinase
MVPVEGNDEIADLGRVFNSMSAEISARERDLKALLAEQSRLHDEAVASSRAKSEFIATMSHELRTPLNAIIGFSEIIREDMARGSPASVDQDASRALAAARHLLKLINDVLDIAKIESNRVDVEIEDFDVHLLVQDVIATMHAAAQANNVAVCANLEGDLGVARTDEFKIKQCLLNLLSNAIKFSGGGAVTITAKRTILEGREHLVFEVCDTGIGMTGEQLERVFKPFEQADASMTRRFGGTGLGLSIVQGLVQALHGNISASSVPGGGSTFTFRLPLNLDAAGICIDVRESHLSRAVA